MRFASILREAVLNTVSGTSKAALFAVTLGLVMTLLGGADVAAVASIDQQAQRFRQAGGSTIIFKLDGEINGAACDALTSVQGVLAAGAIRQKPVGETASTLPGEEIPTFDVSPTFGGFQALGRPQPGRGILISSDLAQTLGTRAGGQLALDDGSPVIGGAYSYADDGRVPGYGYAILSPQDTTAPFDECWAEIWPVTDDLTALMATTLVPGATSSSTNGGPGPQLQQLNASRGTSFDGDALFHARITRYAPAVTAVIAFALGFAAIWRRRLELAAARHAKVSRAAQACQTVSETLVWSLLGTVLTICAITVLVVVEQATDAGPLASLAARVIVAGAPCTLAGALVATLLVREKQLFSYFRGR